LVHNRYYLNIKKPLIMIPTHGKMNQIEKKNPLESASLLQDPLSRKFKILSDFEGKYLTDNYNLIKLKFTKSLSSSKIKTQNTSKSKYLESKVELLDKKNINQWITHYKFNLAFI